MVDYSKFDKMVNQEQLQKDIENAEVQTYDEVPKGSYIISVERMEIKETNKGDKLMFSFGGKIKETINAPKKQDNRWIFFNRVISGNKVTERWNDGVAIKGILTWIEELADVKLEFTSYSNFASDIEELFDEIHESIEVQINYDPEAFNSIQIEEVFDI